MLRIILTIIATVLAILLLLPSTKPVIAKHGMVVSEQGVASQVGVDILKAGGNAVDAAVAVGYALAVVNPCCGNIGGGGFMTLHLADGKNIVLNFREKAPLAATATMFLTANGDVKPDASTKGYLAVGVPGTVMGLDTALKQYGTMTRQQVMQPAIQLAEQGYHVTAFDAKWFGFYAEDFRRDENIRNIFLHNNSSYTEGELLKQSNLAQSLRLIAANGPDAFYKGSIAKEIVAASKANGGILSLEDFANYTVETSTPVHCVYHGYDIYAPAPPSSGGITLCEMLNILKHFSLNEPRLFSPNNVRNIVEAMRFAFNDRNNLLGDPKFANNPQDMLLSRDYTKRIVNIIKSTPYAIPQQTATIDHSQTDTTHYSVVDAKGNAVSVTYTLNGFYGAKVIAGNTGFFLNDEMDDFSSKPGVANKFNLIQNNSNTIAPGKRPLSSMTPTIILQNNKIAMALGSPGGPRIITSVLLTILNVVNGKLNIQQAVNAPRFHYQGFPDAIDYEPLALGFFTRVYLEYFGYHLAAQSPWSAVEAIVVDQQTQTLEGANDRRRPAGAAIGY